MSAKLRLLAEDRKLSLFSTAESVGQTIFRNIWPSATQLAMSNIKLLTLIQKLINKVLNTNFNVTEVNENTQKAPGAEKTAADEEAAAELRIHQARAVLIELIKDLVGFARQTTSLSKGILGSSSNSNESKLLAKIGSWISGDARFIEDMLQRNGKLDKIKENYADDPSALVFTMGDSIIADLYDGLQNYTGGKKTQVSRLLYALNGVYGTGSKQDARRFMEQHKKEIILMVIQALNIKQTHPSQNNTKRMRAMNDVFNTIVSKVGALSGGRVDRYFRMASRAIKMAEASVTMDKINIIQNIVNTISSPQFLQNRDAIINKLMTNPQLKGEFEEALKLFGTSPDKLDAAEAQKIVTEYEAFIALVTNIEQSVGYAEKIDPMPWINEYNSAAQASSQEALAKLNQNLDHLTSMVGQINNLLESIHRMADSGNSMAKLYAPGVATTVEYGNPVLQLVRDVKAAAAGTKGASFARGLLLFADDGSVSEPQPAGTPVAAPQADTTMPNTPVAPQYYKITDELATRLVDLWKQYLEEVKDFDNSFPQLGPKPIQQDEKDNGDDDLPRLSFAKDTAVAPLLKDIRQWFMNNEQLIANVMRPLIRPTGTMGTKSEEDLRLIAAAARSFKEKAVLRIDELLK